jgi:hypothetical protein
LKTTPRDCLGQKRKRVLQKKANVAEHHAGWKAGVRMAILQVNINVLLGCLLGQNTITTSPLISLQVNAAKTAAMLLAGGTAVMPRDRTNVPPEQKCDQRPTITGSHNMLTQRQVSRSSAARRHAPISTRPARQEQPSLTPMSARTATSVPRMNAASQLARPSLVTARPINHSKLMRTITGVIVIRHLRAAAQMNVARRSPEKTSGLAGTMVRTGGVGAMPETPLVIKIVQRGLWHAQNRTFTMLAAM